VSSSHFGVRPIRVRFTATKTNCLAHHSGADPDGARTLRWIVQHYHPIRTIGEQPLKPAGRGMVLFDRTPDAPL
jgi:hypothetical protein